MRAWIGYTQLLRNMSLSDNPLVFQLTDRK